MSTLPRSAPLPYATTDAAALAAMARRLLIDPRQIGPIRLLGVGFSGLSHVLQESLFPDLELAASDTNAGAETARAAPDVAGPVTGETEPWRVGDDVTHREQGHGCAQGAGHRVATVRFQTRGPGPGPARTFASDTTDITSATPLDSLDWADYVAAVAHTASEQAVDDVV